MPSEPRADAARPLGDSNNDSSSDHEPDEELGRLRRANAELRARADDLAGALLARDLELARLRERCGFLARAVEQQDAVLARLYATAAGPPLARPVGPVGSVGPVGTPPAADKPTVAASFEPAREMLESHLDAAGWLHCGRVAEALADGVPSPSPAQPAAPADGDQVTAALDRLLARPGAAGRRSASSSASSSPLSSSSGRRRPALGRQDSSASEQDFAKSAGFLRRPDRKAAVRLSVSDFGLLGDDAAGSNQAEEVGDGTGAPADGDSGDGAPADSGDGTGSADPGDPGARTKQRLFASVDAAEAARSRRGRRSWTGGEAQQDEAGDGDGAAALSYGEFLARVSLPASRDVLDQLRRFVRSVLGPRGDGRPPRASDFADYEFFGRHELRRRCVRFLRATDAALQSHPAWRGASEAALLAARDGVEKFVMDKLHDAAFSQLGECLRWRQEDDKLLRRMQLLSFVTPDMLDIKPSVRNEVVWSMAEDELRRINAVRAPGDKIRCIVRCCSVLFGVLSLARGGAGGRPGADDFLPVFIYVVLHSQIPRLFSNCEYIAAYRNPADLMSKAGYCFVNLRSAVEFISVMDASMLSVPSAEFDRLYSEREQQLQL